MVCKISAGIIYRLLFINFQHIFPINWLQFGVVSLPLGVWDGLRYFIVALPEPSIYLLY